MDEENELAAQFGAHRAHLRAVAFRMLGSVPEADDAVQEAWLRVGGADTSEVANLGGWLTTVVARVCLDMLRARKARREEPEEDHLAKPAVEGEAASPEQDTLLADSVGAALLVVLETLAPAERLAFVLHDMFDLPFDEIASIVGCSQAAARQLASRARRRVRGAPVDAEASADPGRQREVVAAFLTASRGGDLAALLELLDPEVVLRSDRAAVAASAVSKGAFPLAREIRGAEAVASLFCGRAQAARPALLDGAVGAVWAPGGQIRVAFELSFVGGRIAAIDVIADPELLAELHPTLLGG